MHISLSPVLILMTAVACLGCQGIVQAKTFPGTGTVDYAGYPGCLKLENEHARVILSPHCGGRVLEYSLNGQNALYHDPAQDGWTYTPGKPSIDPCGGRLDIGPEMVSPRRTDLWLGAWQAEITGPRAARLTSAVDQTTGVQLIRTFALDKSSARLRVTQTIVNKSDKTQEWCHWSRTLAAGGGIAIVPLNPKSRFPKGYLMYGPGSVLNFAPADPNVRTRDGFLEIIAPPTLPKYGLDSMAGWLAYITTNNLLFVKRFPVYPNRVYNEINAFTVALYYENATRTELEPIGPRETIKPGRSVSFTENWWLLPYDYPQAGQQVDLKALAEYAEKNAKQ